MLTALRSLSITLAFSSERSSDPLVLSCALLRLPPFGPLFPNELDWVLIAGVLWCRSKLSWPWFKAEILPLGFGARPFHLAAVTLMLPACFPQGAWAGDTFWVRIGPHESEFLTHILVGRCVLAPGVPPCLAVPAPRRFARARKSLRHPMRGSRHPGQNPR